MDYNDFKSLCENRRSIHYFDDTAVSKDDVLQLLALAQLAPSVENLQPWHFHVIFSQQLRHALMDASYYGNFVEGASVFIVVTANRSFANKAKEPVWNEKELEFSCMGAMTHILLGATAMNIGSCWVSLARGKAHELLHLPAHEVVVGGLMLGHYKRGEKDGGKEHQRNALESTYTIHE